MPTIAWKAKRTTFTGGRSSGGTLSSPVTVAFGSWWARTDSSLGIRIAPVTSPSEYQPPMWNGAPSVVGPSPSSVASLTGWRSVTVRAAQSPTTTCTGAASAANVSGTTSPVRT
jgi:hypothetical protein